MEREKIRWLHLSDFHTGKDTYGQIQLFDSIIEHVKNLIKSDQKPDFIFITGDIANKGKKAEYELFCNNFIFPLYDLVKDTTKIFIVPGNHDVNRDEARATKRYGVINEIPEFFDPTSEGLHERKILLPRFENYAEADMHELLTEGSDWISSTRGYYTYIYELEECKIGILGVNSAWLSEGENDKHHMTPGKALIEEGLKKLEGCKFKIVLGHHPLQWFDEDITPIRSLFGKKNVIYLHGHLHKNSGSQEYGAGRKFLTIESGAAFRARESEKWINRLLCCELDIEKEQVEIQPLQWSKEYQEWALDGLAYPNEYRSEGSDVWVFRIKSQKDTSHSRKIGDKEDPIPQGWENVDDTFLARWKKDMSDEDILKFYDGRIPSWKDALSQKIPRRRIVSDLANEVDDASKRNELMVTLILGAGGEGKSTVFLQTLTELAKADNKWKILWLANPARDILWPSRFLNQLNRDERTWIIAADDADLISKHVYETAKSFSRAGRNDIQFLLCCRDSDWMAAEANEWPWKEYVVFNEKRMRGISLDDSKIIVQAWSTFGSKGLGRLDGLEFDEAVGRLFYASKSEEEKYKEEGAFLGAMLRVRMGDELKSHVKSLLLRLRERRVKDDTLMTAFAYIAVMHSEQLYILTKDIIAGALNCKLSEVKKAIIGPLGDEAAVSTGGDRIFTRHRAIAEAAVEILSEDFHIDFDEIILTLAEEAYRIHCKGLFLSYFVKWKYISEHFLKKGNKALAIRLDQALLKIDPADTHLIVHLSRLLREAGQPELSCKVFREIDHGLIGPIRGFYFEWSVAEGTNGNDAMAVCLAGIALSDNVEFKPIEIRTASMCLSGIALNSGRLFEKYNNELYLRLCAGAVQIGLSLPALNETDRILFDKRKSRYLRPECESTDIKAALRIFQKSIGIAWDHREASLPEWTIRISDLNFKKLADLVGIEI